MKTYEKIIIILLIIYPIILVILLNKVSNIQTNNIINRDRYKENQVKKEFKTINIPNCKTKRMLIDEKVCLIECNNEQFYIISKYNNKIVGPMNKETSMQAFKDYLNEEMIDWKE